MSYTGENKAQRYPETVRESITRRYLKKTHSINKKMVEKLSEFELFVCIKCTKEATMEAMGCYRPIIWANVKGSHQERVMDFPSIGLRRGLCDRCKGDLTNQVENLLD